jgi:hypothetical protein
VILKATGGTATTPSSFIAVQITGSNVMVSTTTNTGASIVAQATFPATFASGDTITATADATGHVYVWKTSGTATTLVGDVAIPASGPNAWPGRTGGGRIGLALQSGGRADNFQGGSLP